MKLYKLEFDKHWEKYTTLDTLDPVIHYVEASRVKQEIKNWLKEQGIHYISFWWRSEPYLLFFRKNDVIYFKLTWS